MANLMKGGGNLMSYRGKTHENINIDDYYYINKILGEGTYGRVFLGSDKLTSELFAIKEIKFSQVRKKKLLKKELEFLQKLNNPNLIKFYEYYQDKNKIYFVTQLCLGGELYYYIKSEFYNRLSLKTRELNVKIIMYQLLKGLQYIHEIGLIHRDLKLENILLVKKNDISDIRIIDFGLAIESDKNNNEKVGTYYTMAPEVIKKNYDNKCDNWSLGIIMYILLSGYRPYDGNNDEEIQASVRLSIIREVSFPDKLWHFFSKNAKRLIKNLLTYNSKKRITTKDALNSKWFDNFNPIEYINKEES